MNRIEQTTLDFDSALGKKKHTNNEDQICTYTDGSQSWSKTEWDRVRRHRWDKPVVNWSDLMWSCSLQGAMLRNSHMNAAEGLKSVCDNYLHCESEAWCKWAPNSCCQFGCRIGPTCLWTMITKFCFHIKQTAKDLLGLQSLQVSLNSTYRVLVVSRGTVCASLLPGLLK